MHTKGDQVMVNKSDVVPTSEPTIRHHYKDVVLTKGKDGFGFVLRGAKCKSAYNETATDGSTEILNFLMWWSFWTRFYQYFITIRPKPEISLESGLRQSLRIFFLKSRSRYPHFTATLIN